MTGKCAVQAREKEEGAADRERDASAGIQNTVRMREETAACRTGARQDRRIRCRAELLRKTIRGLLRIRVQAGDVTETEEEMAAMTDEEKRSLLKPNERIDDLQRSHLEIIQNPERFSFGMDAVLLSGFARAARGDRVLDLGTGTGIIPILMSAKTKAAHFTALEIQKESADMARRSVLLNRLEERIEIVTGDIREAGALFAAASFDVVTSNPPYMTNQHGLRNPQDAKALARHEICCSLEDLVSAAEKLVRPGGHFYMVHRPFRLAEIMVTLCAHHLEPKRMRLVYPYADREPNMVLLDCVRGARSRITVEKPLIVYREPGRYTDEIYEIYGY